MKRIGTYTSKKCGNVTVLRGTYGSSNGPTAVALELENGEPLAVLSVNMYQPQCSHDSRDLPEGCFYAKDWSENAVIALEALTSGLFFQRDDLPAASSGFVTALAWEIKQ